MVGLINATAWQSFLELFAEMSPIVYVLFIVGVIFCIIEIFVPGFGAFGISGIIMIVAAIIFRMIDGGNVWMLVYMTLIAAVIFVICFIVLSHSVQKGRLSKSDIFDVGSSVPTGITDGTADYSSFVGKTAITCNFLRPIGQAKFEDGSIIDVIAKNGFIEQDKNVKVVSAEGQKVIVEAVE